MFHNTTARYNGYFYANEALKEADVKLEEMHSERWDETLPLFLESNEETAQQIFPLMERAIEKCTRVVDRHTMAPSSRNRKSFKRPVLNKWIDDNYRVIGQSYYMKGDYPKAEEIFTYLSRTVASPDAEAWAFSWLGRTHADRQRNQGEECVGQGPGVAGIVGRGDDPHPNGVGAVVAGRPVRRGH